MLTAVRWSAFLHLSGFRPSLHQQYSPNELAEQRRREEGFAHTRHTAAMGNLQVGYRRGTCVTRGM